MGNSLQIGVPNDTANALEEGLLHCFIPLILYHQDVNKGIYPSCRHIPATDGQTSTIVVFTI